MDGDNATREILRAELRRKLAKAREDLEQATWTFETARDGFDEAVSDMKAATEEHARAIAKAWEEYDEANGFR